MESGKLYIVITCLSRKEGVTCSWNVVVVGVGELLVYTVIAIPLPADLRQPSWKTRRRNLLTFVQLQTRTDCYKFSFFPQTIKDWNELPERIVTFRPAVKDFFLRDLFIYLDIYIFIIFDFIIIFIIITAIALNFLTRPLGLRHFAEQAKYCGVF